MKAATETPPPASARRIAQVFSTLALAGLMLGTPGCGGGDKPQQAAKQPPKRSIADEIAQRNRGGASAAGLDESAKQAFADKLEQAFADKNAAAISALIDTDGMIDRVVDSLSVGSKNARQLKQGLQNSIGSRGRFAGTLLRSVGGGTYELLRFHQRDGRPYALFRMEGDQGLNYHDFRLGSRGGEVYAEDIYVYLTGEHMTATLRAGLLPAAAQMSKSWLEKLGSSDKAFIDNQEKIGLLVRQVRNKDGRGALRTFDQLSPEAKKMKVALIQRCMAAALVGGDEVQKAVNAYEAAFPGDAALALLSIDSHIVAERYDEAVKALDSLDESVGGDPHLQSMRAEAMIAKGDLPAAERFARLGVEQAPNRLYGHDILATVLAMRKDYAGLYELLKESDDRVDWAGLRTSPVFDAFLDSPEGEQWLTDKGYLQQGSLGGGKRSAGKPNAGKPSGGRGRPSGPLNLSPEELEGLLTWTDKSGKFEVEAYFVELDTAGATVTLRKKNGKEVTVPLDRLSVQSVSQAMQASAEQKLSGMRGGAGR